MTLNNIVPKFCLPKLKYSQVLFTFISVLVCAPCSSVTPPCSRPDQPALLEALRPVFNMSSIRPVMNLNTTTNISIGFILYGILGVDEKAQVLTTYIWQTMTWRSEFIRWDPEECGTTHITLPRSLLWVPDVVVNECMYKNSAPFVPYCYMYSDGTVVDGQPVRLVSSCRLNIYMFPFDIQTCTLGFNSYLHNMKDMSLTEAMSAQEILEFSKAVITTMGEWELIGLTVESYIFPDSNEENYQEIRYFVSVRRRATLYVVNLIIPSSFLVVLDIFSFLLPPKNVDRSLFKMTLILGYTVFLFSINDMLPITGDTIPLMNVFLSLCLTLMVASLLETILITNLLSGSAQYPRIPRWIKVFVIHILGRLVGLPPQPKNVENTVIQNPSTQEIKDSSPVLEGITVPELKEPLDGVKMVQELRRMGIDLQALHLHLKKHLSESQGSEEWIQVGFIIDRLLFCFYIIFITVSFITIIVIWVNSFNTN